MYKLILAIVLTCSLQTVANPANQPQTKAKISVTELEKFDPNAQVPSLKGYQLRARKIVVPAGESIAEHAHETRPGIVYIESGEIMEYRGEIALLLKAGDSIIEDFATVHAYKNISDQDCVLIAFDLPATLPAKK